MECKEDLEPSRGLVATENPIDYPVHKPIPGSDEPGKWGDVHGVSSYRPAQDECPADTAECVWPEHGQPESQGADAWPGALRSGGCEG